MKYRIHELWRRLAILVIGSGHGLFASAEDRPAEPYSSPAFAQSAYSETHYLAHYTPLAGPIDSTRRLQANEVQWKITGPVTWTLLYSEPYPNGKQVIWTGAHDRIAKVDADTLETLAEYRNEEYEYYSDAKIRTHIDNVNQLQGIERADYYWDVLTPSMPNFQGFYRFLSSKNELYLPYRHRSDGSLVLRVYGEADASDPASAISVKREWRVPSEVSGAMIYAMSMTPDRQVIIAMSDGKLIALPEDFSSYQVFELPKKVAEKSSNADTFAAFLRNGITLDDRGGIYVVTRDHFHRVQWTGDKLSLDEADGAWTAGYPNALGLGSGTTPSLMGWGDGEDNLVLIADGSVPNNELLAFWRNDIPDDWQGIPGYDRRVAGVTPVLLGTAEQAGTRVENSIVVYGNGAFLVSSQPEEPFEGQASQGMQAIKEFLSADFNEMRGATRISWNADSRILSTSWRNPTNFATSICAISGATELVYCWGARDGEWTMEALDWKSGRNAFHYVLGRDQKYNVFGGIVTIAPNGAIDCGCGGGLGIVRIDPTVK